MANPAQFQFDLPLTGRPLPFPLVETLYPGVKDHWLQSTSHRIFDPIFGVTTLVIHATAGASSEGAMSVMKAHKASWHWLVPDENEESHGHFVWACAPEARAAWHVRNSCSHPDVQGGAGKINHFSLGVEIVNTQDPGSPDPFSAWQVEATAGIIRYCWAKYPNLKHVVSHAKLDPDRRSDPGANFAWDRLRELALNGAFAGADKALAFATPMSLLPKSKLDTICC